MIALIIYLISQLTILGPATISGADPGVLEAVAARRIRNGWGLTEPVGGYDVLVAPADCGLLGRSGWLRVDGRTYSAIVVDCESEKHRGQMRARRLLCDVNGEWPELVHKRGWLVLR